MVVMVIFALYLGWCIVDRHEESASIAILGFHDIVSDEAKDNEARFQMWVAGERSFRAQMAYLKEQGYQTWSCIGCDTDHNDLTGIWLPGSNVCDRFGSGRSKTG